MRSAVIFSSCLAVLNVRDVRVNPKTPAYCFRRPSAGGNLEGPYLRL